MGSTATAEQRDFVDAVLNSLKTQDLSPRIMNENEWSFEQPLKAIKKIMQECEGAVVIAFTRMKFHSGIETKKNMKEEISNIALPTPWNHIEASMAYAFGLPLLVIAENGLKSEGLIENGYDWQVYWTELDPNIVTTEKFVGFLGSWRKAVENFSQQKSQIVESSISVDKLSIGTLLKSMSIPQLWKMAAAIIVALSAVASIAFKLGGGKWPWM